MTDLFGKIKECPTNACNSLFKMELRVGQSVIVLYDCNFFLYMLVGQKICAKKCYNNLPKSIFIY